MKCVVEVDQSIKIEEHGDTVLAFANSISFAIVIPDAVKQESLSVLRRKGKSTETARLMLFAAGLYFLLRDYLHRIDRVVIDVEYTGKDAAIRSFLLRYIWQSQPEFEPEQIVFELVGKDSPADRKARSVRLKEDANYRVVTTKEMSALL